MMDLAAARRIVERNFRVYEARSEKVRGEVAAHRLFIMFPAGEFDRRFEAAKAELLAAEPDAMVFVRREQGEDVLWLAMRPPVAPSRPGVHALLLGLTILTTAMAGALAWQSFQRPEEPFRWGSIIAPDNLLWGTLAFALPLLAILGIHETAHFIAARKHRLRATPPYFIPAPPLLMPIGTFGAYIRMKDPMPDRKALFDVGASGPIAGFLVALPVVILGAFLTTQAAHALPDMDRPTLLADGGATLEAPGTGQAVLRWDAMPAGYVTFNLTAPAVESEWAYTLRATITRGETVTTQDSEHGLAPGAAARHSLLVDPGADKVEVLVAWDDHLVHFGDPLLVMALDKVFPSGDHLTHPTFFAGWVGLLVTGINLLPVGQLDGGHVARAVFGDRARHVSTLAAVFLVLLALWFASWMLMALFVLLLGIHHPPPLNDRTPLDRKRLVLAVVVLVVFALCFVPIPIQG